MSIYKSFKTDPDVEKKGVWLDYPDGVSILVARAGGANKTFIKAMERVYKSHKHAFETGRMDRDVANKLSVEIYAKTVVLDWKNVTDEHGVELPFTYDNVVKVLTDLPDLFTDIQTQAQEQSYFLESVRADSAKN
jgi:hypothetical protein